MESIAKSLVNIVTSLLMVKDFKFDLQVDEEAKLYRLRVHVPDYGLCFGSWVNIDAIKRYSSMAMAIVDLFNCKLIFLADYCPDKPEVYVRIDDAPELLFIDDFKKEKPCVVGAREEEWRRNAWRLNRERINDKTRVERAEYYAKRES